MKLNIIKFDIGGFHKRLLGTVLLSLFVVIVIFTAFFYYQSSSLLKREFIEKGKALGKNFSFNSLTGIKTEDMSLLYPALLGLAEQEDVMLVGIYDTDGSMLITHAKEEGIDTVLSREIVDRIGIGETVLTSVGDSYEFLFPVKEGFLDEGVIDAFEEQTVGIVRITLSTLPMSNALAKTTRTLVFFGIIILVMGGFLAMVMARAIAGPIGSISDKMEEIGSGKADLTKRLSIPAREDELGRLAKGFNNFVDALSRIFKEITTAAPELLEQAQGLASVSEELTASSEEITGALQEIAEASVKQLHDVNKIVEEAKNTQAIAKETVEAAQRSQDSSDRIRSLAQEGMSESQATTENTGRIVGAIDKLSQRINDLANDIEKIPRIVSTINGIAEKTNILALNAAIEAARAGEAGRGFAVVAEEVTKLAEMSSEQADEIGKIIKGLIEKTGYMVKEAQQTSLGVRESKDVLMRSSDSLKTISEEVMQTAKDIVQIVEKGEINQGAVNRLATVLDEVASAARQNAAAAQEVSASVEEQGAAFNQLVESTQILTLLSEKLKRLVTRFTV